MVTPFGTAEFPRLGAGAVSTGLHYQLLCHATRLLFNKLYFVTCIGKKN